MNANNANRNLHPHAEAMMAMWLFGARYAASGGGSMDFWDSLTKSDQWLCVRAVNDIIALQYMRVGWSQPAMTPDSSEPMPTLFRCQSCGNTVTREHINVWRGDTRSAQFCDACKPDPAKAS